MGIPKPRGKPPIGCAWNYLQGVWVYDGKTQKDGCEWDVAAIAGRGGWVRIPPPAPPPPPAGDTDTTDPQMVETVLGADVVAYIQANAKPPKGLVWSEEHQHLIPEFHHWESTGGGLWVMNGYSWDPRTGLKEGEFAPHPPPKSRTRPNPSITPTPTQTRRPCKLET